MNVENQLTRTHVYALQVGMFVEKLDIPWEQSPFILQGFEIATQADIKALQQCCDYVYINVERQKKSSGSVKASSNASLLETFKRSADTYEETSSLVKSMMDDIRFGNQLNVTVAKNAVAHCVDQVLTDSDAMLLLTQLKNSDEYTSQHSLNVCILSIIFGRYLHLNKEQLNKLGLCGLLHDMGKMKVPTDILNKPGKFTPEEKAIMQSHTTEGRNILMSARGIPDMAVDVAYTHHERLDGQGYPRGLQASGITPTTRLVSIVDTYDAITSDRVYQKGKLHLDAINILTKNRSSHFESSLVIKFIDCIGIYPVGNPVKLSSGEVGVIIKTNGRDKVRPIVLKILDESLKPIPHVLINLADDKCIDDNGQRYRIIMVLPKEYCHFDFYQFYRQGGIELALANAPKSY